MKSMIIMGTECGFLYLNIFNSQRMWTEIVLKLKLFQSKRPQYVCLDMNLCCQSTSQLFPLIMLKPKIMKQIFAPDCRS